MGVSINEIHYDNTGGDVGEFVELAITDGTSLEGWSLVFYNGSGGASYRTVDLSELAVSDPVDGVAYAVASVSGIQNGSPDGVALVDAGGSVVEFLSYEGSFTAADGPAAGETSTDIGVFEPGTTQVGWSLQKVGGVWSEPAPATPGAPNETAPPEPLDLTIPEIQGAGLTSDYEGELVRTTGIVTALEFRGFYVQSAEGDGDDATSDAIFVFAGFNGDWQVGDEVEITGFVSERVPGGAATGNQPTTQISGDVEVAILSTGNDLPDAVLIGGDGRAIPTESIDDDPATYDPEADGLDFWESLEAMRVTAEDLNVVASTNRFGEIFAATEDATGYSDRGTLNISPDDFNPERIQIDEDSDVFEFDTPDLDVGDRIESVTGVVTYAFGNYEIVPTEALGTIVPGGLTRETTALSGDASHLTVATYNVLNLDPNDADGDADIADGRFEAVARDILENLGAPDIVALQEVQDNSGSDDDGTVSASDTLQLLVDTMDALDDGVVNGSTGYAWIDNTFILDGASGGQPGGNIRTAYLYDTSRVTLVEGSVGTIGSQAEGGSFFDARLPLTATFEFNGEEIDLVNVHFSSKGGSAPIMGTTQPFEELQNALDGDGNPVANGSLDERLAQAMAVAYYIDEILAEDPDANVAVLGDFNEFEFLLPLGLLEDAGLTNLTNWLAENERYSFIFQGNSQSLDHILVSDALVSDAEFDAVHINTEFAETSSRASDHDPLVARFEITPDDVIAVDFQTNRGFFGNGPAMIEKTEWTLGEGGWNSETTAAKAPVGLFRKSVDLAEAGVVITAEGPAPLEFVSNAKGAIGVFSLRDAGADRFLVGEGEALVFDFASDANAISFEVVGDAAALDLAFFADGALVGGGSFAVLDGSVAAGVTDGFDRVVVSGDDFAIGSFEYERDADHFAFV